MFEFVHFLRNEKQSKIDFLAILRYAICQIIVQDEKLSSDKSAAENFVSECQNFTCEANLNADQIYNADKMGSYWKYLPEKTLVHKTEKKMH